MSWRRELLAGLLVTFFLGLMTFAPVTGRVGQGINVLRRSFYHLLGGQWKSIKATPAEPILTGALLAENQRLNEMLSLAKRVRGRVVLGHSVGRGPDVWWSKLQIAFPAQGSLPRGIALVITPQGLIGTMDSDTLILSRENGEDFCYGTVSLLSSSKTQLAVVVGESKVPFLLEGRGGYKLILRPVWTKDGDKIEPGDLVLTSGQGKIFTSGLPLGRVSDDTGWADFSSLEATPSEVLIWWR